MKLNDEQNKSVFSGVMLGYMVLVMHILLIIGLGVTVVLIKGIYDFRWLIFIAGIGLLSWSGYYFYRRMKESNRKISDFMSDPALQNRTLEISLLGGMATVKLGHKDENIKLIAPEEGTQIKQLESPQSMLIKELSELNRMLEDGLITREEFIKLKKEVL
ncbi:MAG: gas vesicle protein GvpG [Deltaproteobacteria bacterium]|nr:gas vesicle protein GvpG [Deltaproteobacteria bacterium]